jgi:hypothetical protein
MDIKLLAALFRALARRIFEQHLRGLIGLAHVGDDRGEQARERRSVAGGEPLQCLGQLLLRHRHRGSLLQRLSLRGEREVDAPAVPRGRSAPDQPFSTSRDTTTDTVLWSVRVRRASSPTLSGPVASPSVAITKS